jgi:hypothetical protein
MGRHTLATFLLRALNLLSAVTVTAEGLGDMLNIAQPSTLKSTRAAPRTAAAWRPGHGGQGLAPRASSCR